MKIAVISDVHGNYPALKSVIDDAGNSGADEFIFIGDYIFDMPFSEDVVRTIMGLDNAHVIAGNKEIWLRELLKEDQSVWVREQIGAVYQICRELPNDIISYLAGLKEERYITLPSGRVIYASHYLNDMEQKLKTTYGSAMFHKKMLDRPFTHDEYLAKFEMSLNQDDFSKILADINAGVILFGHNHLQSYGRVGGKLVINPGSCGLPLDFDKNAAYTLLDETIDGFSVTEKRVPYDINVTIEAAKKSDVYARGAIWCELCFLAMRTGRDYFGIFFKIAAKIAESKSESGQYYSDETWREAYDEFCRINF